MRHRSPDEVSIRDSGSLGAVSEQRFWYHQSSPRNRASIEDNGLLTKFDQGGGATPRGIYMTRKPGPVGHEDTWAVDVRGLRLIEDPNSGEDYDRVGQSVYHPKDIPPSRVRLYKGSPGASRVAHRYLGAGSKPLWHLTHKRNFKPSEAARPVSQGGWGVSEGPRLYATTSPFYWHEVSGGGSGPWTRGRKWAVELELLPGHPPVKREDPLRPETVLDPAFVRVKRVIPIEEAIAEETGYLNGEWVGKGYRYKGVGLVTEPRYGFQDR